MARKRKVKFMKIEKLLMGLSVLLLVLIPVSNIFGMAMLSETNIQVEKLKKEIKSQEKRNESLTMKINELQSFDNIQTVAQSQGLAYNSNNVKVVGNK
jgi:cell division protein FtsL